MEEQMDKPSIEMVEIEPPVQLGEALVTAEDSEVDDAPSEDEAPLGPMKRMEFILPFGNRTSNDDYDDDVDDDFMTSSDSYYDMDDSDSYYDEDDSMYSDDTLYSDESVYRYSGRGGYGLFGLSDEWTLKKLARLPADDLEGYTGFASYSQFMAFWQLIEPSVHKMDRVSRGPPPSQEGDSSGRFKKQTLPPEEELILYLIFLSTGMEEHSLAYDFSIPPSTVLTIISLWTKFLYTLLGSGSIWLDAAHVRARLPEDYKEDFPDAQVIVDTLEVRLFFEIDEKEDPFSRSALFWRFAHKKYERKMKALIGVAPHGPVTFVSELCEGSVSDEVLFRRSGLADLLDEDSAIMVADEELVVPDCVKCKVYHPPPPTMPFCKPSDHTKKMIRFWNNAIGVLLRVRDRKLFSGSLSNKFAPSFNEIFTVAALLCNYQNAPQVGPYTRKSWD
ncbi:uncharacterized protein LOC134450457 isoform X1 [Engraulis encrasicolus]|uniref:uncharacterized protein LOC134450457 isoform X1 n=1 Tax=Engraulis encrasicolus TaxID=184585 RepID=UPI002FD4BE21